MNYVITEARVSGWRKGSHTGPQRNLPCLQAHSSLPASTEEGSGPFQACTVWLLLQQQQTLVQRAPSSPGHDTDQKLGVGVLSSVESRQWVLPRTLRRETTVLRALIPCQATQREAHPHLCAHRLPTPAHPCSSPLAGSSSGRP